MNENRARLILNLIIVIASIGLLCWGLLGPNTLPNDILKQAADESFNGRVDSVFRDKWQHNTKRVKLKNGYTYSIYPSWENIIDKGDSLSKKKGALKVEVFKENGTIVMVDYHEQGEDAARFKHGFRL